MNEFAGIRLGKLKKVKISRSETKLFFRPVLIMTYKVRGKIWPEETMLRFFIICAQRTPCVLPTYNIMSVGRLIRAEPSGKDTHLWLISCQLYPNAFLNRMFV